MALAKTKAASRVQRPAPPRVSGAQGFARTRDRLDLRLAATQRQVLAVLVVLAAVAVWRPLHDPFMLPKLTVVVLGAVALLALAGIRAVRLGRLVVPGGPPLFLVGALAGALVLATLFADNIALSLVGQHGRYAGLLAYLAYISVFLVALRLYVQAEPVGLVRAFVVAGGLVATYGLVQLAGWDPYMWSSSIGDAPRFSTMGNTNFAAAYVAVVSPVVAAAVLWRGTSRAWRGAALVVLVPALLYMLATRAAQGPLAALAGFAVLAAAWWFARRRAGDPRPPRNGRNLLMVGPSLLLAVAALGAAVVLVAPAALDSGSGERVYFWQAALSIVSDHPLLGTGLDSFRDHFTRYRPPAHGAALNYQSADSPHNLPLGMLVGGGVPLAMAYLAFVGYTGWTLARGLILAAPERLQTLAAFGGMWTAYQVQSLVSVDVPPLTLLHFVSAAIVLAVARRPTATTASLPFAPAANGALLPRGQGAPRHRATAGLAVVVLLAVATTWTSTRPLRADLAVANARTAPDAAARAAALDRAVLLAPWEGEYRILQAQGRLEADDQEGTYSAVLAAAELRSGSSKLALGASDFARRRGDERVAEYWFEQALRRDPHNPQLLEELAERARTLGDDAEAENYAEWARALRDEYGDFRAR